MYREEDYLPCYSVRGMTEEENTVEKCLKSIDRALNNWFQEKSRGILIISITDKDEHKDKWIEAISHYNDVAYVSTMSLLHGDYECIMFCIPVFQNLGRA